MATNKSVDIPLQVNLTQSAYDILAAGIKDQPVAVGLAQKATVIFDNLANGGVLLTPDQVRKIEQASRKEINRGADVVAAVQGGNNIEEDAKVRKWRLDPVYDDPLEEMARTTGRSVDDLLSDMMNMAIENNWIFGFIPSNGPVFLTDSDLRYWQQVTGKQNPMGADITAAMKQITVEVAA